MQAKEHALKAVNTPFSFEKYKEVEYTTQSKNIQRAENQQAIAESIKPANKEESLYAMIRRFETGQLSDLEPDDEGEQHGETFKKKRKKKGKKGKKDKKGKGGKKNGKKKGKKMK